MYTLIVTDPAKQDIQRSFDWWRDHRSATQATSWYHDIFHAIGTLREHPERCGKAPENDLCPGGIRQLLFGTGRRPTHRIVFTVAVGVVTVLRVRHSSQDDLTLDDVT